MSALTKEEAGTRRRGGCRGRGLGPGRAYGAGAASRLRGVVASGLLRGGAQVDDVAGAHRVAYAVRGGQDQPAVAVDGHGFAGEVGVAGEFGAYGAAQVAQPAA